MKAIAKVNPGVGIDVIEVPAPEAGQGEVLLKVAACGICGSDLHTYEWTKSGRERRGIPIELPRVLGHEPSGVVAAVGEGVTQFKAGDRVASDSWGGCGKCYYCRIGRVNLCEPRYNIGSLKDGALAEYVVVPEFNLYRLPDEIPLEVGAVIEPLGVAVHAVERCLTLKPGDHVLVQGAGPIGLLTALVVRAGGGDVVVTGLASDTVRLKQAQSLGFDTIVSDSATCLDEVRDRTDGRGADIIFECAGALPGAIPLVRKGGEIVVAGNPSSTIELDLLAAIAKELTFTINLGRNPSSWHRSISLLTTGTVDVSPLITHRLPLEKGQEAFDLLRSGEAIKILLFPNADLAPAGV